MGIFNFVKQRINFIQRKITFRKNNRHNFVNAMNIFPLEIVEIGRYTYGDLFLIADNNRNKLKIGNFCAIASDVRFILAGEHDINNISIFPFKKLIATGEYEALSKGDIIIGDDVWIGQGAAVMSGVNIGQGAVIGAHSLVNKDVEPYSVVAGQPAKKIKMRFPPHIVSKLLKIDYSKLNDEMIKGHLNELYSNLNNLNENEIGKILSWLPKKF